MAARAGAAPIWGTQALPGGSARAGEGLGRGAFSPPPRSVSALRPAALSPTLSTPFFLFL